MADGVHVFLRTELDIVAARTTARRIAELLAMDSRDQVRFATAVSELSRNAVVHGGGGDVLFGVIAERDRHLLAAVVTDEGPGIADIGAALSGTAGGSGTEGLGLVRAKRLSDLLRVERPPRGGTRVTAAKRISSDAAASWSELAHEFTSSGRVVVGPEADAMSVQELVEELQRRREEQARLERELEETNRGVVALYAELDDKAERLREASDAKSRFLSSISHELRTPLNSIVALSRLLLDRVDGELTPGQERQVEFIRTSAQDLSVLVDDLLDLAKIEAGRLEIAARPFSMVTLFSGLRAVFRPLATNPAVALVFEPPEHVPMLETDEVKLAQVVRNFISNALKFTYQGEVRVWAEPRGDGQVAILVRDTGIGIAPQDQTRIFEEFTQVAGAHQSAVKGTGLGLPVSRGLAELLGGHVGVDSMPGEGSTFWVQLPLIHPDVERQPDEDAPNPVDHRPTSARAGAPVVLIVDDDPIARYLARQALEHAGLDCLEATGGIDGLARLHEGLPDVVVLDLSMPDLPGQEVLRRLRADDATRGIPVIVNTSAQPEGAEGLGMPQGADAVVLKSEPRDRLVVAVTTAIETGRARPTGRAHPSDRAAEDASHA